MRSTLVVITLLAACHDPAPAPAPMAPPPARVATGPDLSDPLALLPSDSDIIVRMDVAAIRRSPLWTKYKQTVMQTIAPAFVECGYDPFSEITTITAGIPIEGELGNFVIRGIDRDKTLKCLHASKAETETVVTFDGDVVTLTNKSGAVNMLMFIDAHNALMQGSSRPTKETLSQALTIGAPLHADAELQAVDKKLASDAVLSFMSRPSSAAFAKLLQQRTGFPTRYIYATLHATDRLELRAGFVLANADTAAAIAAQMQPKIASVKAYVEKFEEHADGDTLLLDIAITEAQLTSLVGMVKAAMGS